MEFIPEILEDGKLYISEQYGAMLHNCCCGCGTLISTPIRGDAGCWGLDKHSDGSVTLNGSIGNFGRPCQTHYTIKHNEIQFI